MVHIGPGLLSSVLAEVAGRPVGLPLFTEPVLAAPEVSRRLAAFSDALLAGASALRRDELLAGTVRAIVRVGGRDVPVARVSRPEAARIAARAGAALDAAVAGDGPPGETAIAALSVATGHSRFTVYRSFQATYGLSPSDYLRQCRLRSARAMLADGQPAARVAAAAGFADQSHLTRWFARYYGMTPAAYQRATVPGGLSIEERL
jgi:AraC-like DNA-binding protein